MNVPSELCDYVRRGEGDFRWQAQGSRRQGATTITDLLLVSQTWQGIVWQHHLQVFRPDTIHAADYALLVINADYGNEAHHRNVGSLYAEATGLICAFLYDVPNQPLFDGLIEDRLIAHSFLEYLNAEEDSDWPLLYPMTRSATRALDATQAWTRQEGIAEPTRWIVSGASKRGWTTWLTAATDPRVVGILPMVYDNLNIAAQMPHQLEVFQRYSAQISEYTEIRLPEKMQTLRGARLTQIVDPYTYRDRLTLPKLILNGTNDRYWATDALNLYWNDLQGPKHVLYVPNASHSINDSDRVFGTSLAFIEAVITGTTLPRCDGAFEETGKTVALALTTDRPAQAARLWRAAAPTQDFRESRWEALPLEPVPGESNRFRGVIGRPDAGYLAVFGEAVFPSGKQPCFLSTPMHIAVGIDEKK